MMMILTVIAVLAAAAFGALAWRLVQEDRRRSEARVAALIASLEAEPVADVDEPVLLGDAPDASSNADAVVVRGDLFAEPTREESTGFSRLVAVGLVAVVLFTGVAAAWMVAGAPAEPARSAQAVPSQPLELLSLSSSRSGAELSVSGLVRNPAAGGRLEGVAAVVLFFDAQGGFLTSARAPLGLRVLTPGETSPFQLTVTAPEATSRYRVSFRFDEGGIVSHVDRRQTQFQPGAPESPAIRRAGL